MPKEHTHLLLAEIFMRDFLKAAELETRPPFLIDKQAFCLGSVIPDVYFYDFPSFKKRRVSSFLHRARGDNLFKIVVSVIEDGRSRGNDGVLLVSFSLGVLLHLAADMIWHSAIIQSCSSCHKNPKAPHCCRSLACHFRIESVLDILMLEHLRNTSRFPDFSRHIRPLSRVTKNIVRVFVDELNKIEDSALSVDSSTTIRCLITQAVSIYLFQKRPLYWVSYAADIVTLKRFDHLQAVFYPPRKFMEHGSFIRLAPNYKEIRGLSRNKFFDASIEKTLHLARRFTEIALAEQRGALAPEDAFEKLLERSVPSGVNGHSRAW